MSEQNVVICEARPEDAEGLADLLALVTSETPFLIFGTEAAMTAAELNVFLEGQLESENQICLVAKVDTKIVGLLNLSSSPQYFDAHVGDLFIAVAKSYWSYGLGSFLMEALMAWVEQGTTIRRLELTVQTRNSRALSLYHKFGFIIEGTKRRAIKTATGDFLDVYMMSKWIDEA